MPHTDRPFTRADLEDQVMERFHELMTRVAVGHAPEFLAVDITMAQLKALYLVGTRGPLHISALADLLGVSLSTGSGVVDRLVEHGLLERRHADVDRRHVVASVSPEGVALMERMRELNARRVRSMLVDLTDDDLAALGRILTSFARQAASETAPAARPRHRAQHEGTP